MKRKAFSDDQADFMRRQCETAMRLYAKQECEEKLAQFTRVIYHLVNHNRFEDAEQLLAYFGDLHYHAGREHSMEASDGQ